MAKKGQNSLCASLKEIHYRNDFASFCSYLCDMIFVRWSKFFNFLSFTAGTFDKKYSLTCLLPLPAASSNFWSSWYIFGRGKPIILPSGPIFHQIGFSPAPPPPPWTIQRFQFALPCIFGFCICFCTMASASTLTSSPFFHGIFFLSITITYEQI